MAVDCKQKLAESYDSIVRDRLSLEVNNLLDNKKHKSPKITNPTRNGEYEMRNEMNT